MTTTVRQLAELVHGQVIGNERTEIDAARRVLTGLAEQPPQVLSYQEREAKLRHNLISSHRALCRWEDSLVEGHAAAASYRRLLERLPEVDDYRGELLTTLRGLGIMAVESERLKGVKLPNVNAKNCFEEAVALGGPLMADHPQVRELVNERTAIR